MTWASSHTFRRTLVTDAHDAGTPDRHIAGQNGHGRIKVVQDHYIARVPASTVAADLRDLTPRFAPVANQESDSGSDPAAPPG
jgi:integrase